MTVKSQENYCDYHNLKDVKKEIYFLFLCYSSFAKVRSRCELHMVADHLGFLHGECKSMVQGERCRDLQNMYPLLRSVSGGVQVLVLHVMDHIKQQGLEAVTGLRGDNVIYLFSNNHFLFSE